MSDELTTEKKDETAQSFDDKSDENAVVEPENKHSSDEDAKAAKEADRKLRAESYKVMARAGNFGLFLIIAVAFGWFIGNAMDKFFGIEPVFTVFWIVAAVGASIMEVVRSVKAAQKLGEEEKGANSDV